MQPLPADFFDFDAPSVARALIGRCLLIEGVGGTIVETEAYAAGDPASHSYRGPTKRNASMFGPAGHAYVYLSYGMHIVLNLVCGARDGSAVLVRALEPTHGIDLMIERRGTSDPRLLCSGPGRLGQALGVTAAMDGAPLHRPPFFLGGEHDPHVVAGPRIGITRGTEAPWRYCRQGSRFLSRPV